MEEIAVVSRQPDDVIVGLLIGKIDSIYNVQLTYTVKLCTNVSMLL